MKRRPAGRGDGRRFTASAIKTHKKNVPAFVPRGGFRL